MFYLHNEKTIRGAKIGAASSKLLSSYGPGDVGTFSWRLFDRASIRVFSFTKKRLGLVDQNFFYD